MTALTERLTPWIADYRQQLPRWTREELYKWRAVQVFQENWDLGTADFPAMLRRSLAETGNLLTSVQYFARLMIERFADQFPGEVRAAFEQLFDESHPLTERMPRFKAAAEDWRERFEGAPAASHYQDERAMLVYLTLRYPDRYYLFKPMMYQDFAALVDVAVDRRQRAKVERVIGYIALANQVRDILAQDSTLLAAHRARLPANVYPDQALHLLTQDFIYCTVRTVKEQDGKIKDGLAWLSDSAEGGDEPDTEQAREQPLAWAIGAGVNGYLWEDWKASGEMSIGWDDLGDLRDYESKEAIRQELLAETTNGSSRTNDALACWQFCQDMRPGDYVVAKQGRSAVLGLGRVIGEYEFQDSRSEFQHVRRVKWLLEGYWERTADASLPTKTLTEVTYYKRFIQPILNELENQAQLRLIEPAQTKPTGGGGQDQSDPQPKPARPAYTLDDATADLFMPTAELNGLLTSLRRKKNLILQGPPGVGKSFVARRLAYLLLGEQDADRVEMVQFHPSYSYEDFIMGYRATEHGGFLREAGVFLKFVRDVALANPDKPHVFIIDELNRANLGKVLGECMLLLESDKRGSNHKVMLPYGGEYMYLPENLYLIGTMNTADRSLALVDFALRRRFAFKRLQPELGERFADYLTQRGVATDFVGQLVAAVRRVNDKIEQDRTLGPDFLIGHSYYSEGPQAGETDQAWYERVLEDEIGTQLEEYWIETPAQAKAARQLLRLHATMVTGSGDE